MHTLIPINGTNQIKPLLGISCANTKPIFSYITFTMDILEVVINSIISAGCPITFRAYCAMSSGCTVYCPGCNGSNYSAVIWCNDIKIAIMKKAAATQDKEMAAFFFIWCQGVCLHMIPVNLQIITDDRFIFSIFLRPLSLCARD